VVFVRGHGFSLVVDVDAGLLELIVLVTLPVGRVNRVGRPRDRRTPAGRRRRNTGGRSARSRSRIGSRRRARPVDV
jgi:hypothetical protein